MNLTGYPSNHIVTRFVSVMFMMFIMISAPSAVLAVDKEAHQERVEVRIKVMHEKLKISAAQEEQWAKIEQAMREDAKKMDSLTQARVDHAKDMTAIDDLKSYYEVTEAHADGIKKLIPLFTTLYDGMSDEQKKTADTLFRHGFHKHGEHHGGNQKLDTKL